VRARRALLGTLLGVVGLVVLTALTVMILLSSKSVAKKVIAIGLGKSKGLEIADIRGSLKGPLYLFGVSYRSGALTALVDSVLIDWRPSRLLLGRIELVRLYASGVHLTLPDSAPPDTAGTARARLQRPVTPLPVVLGDVAIRGIEINAPGELTLRAGELTLGGTLAHYRFDLRGDGYAPWLGAVRAHLTGTGGLEQVTLDSSTASVLGGTLSTTGNVGWWPKLEWALVVAGDSVRPARFFPHPAKWPGQLGFRLATAGVIDSSGPVGRAKVDSLGGRLRGRSLAGHGEFSFAPSGYEIAALDASWGSARLLAHGVLHDTVAVSYDLAIADLRTATRRTRGSLQVVGTARGPRQTPHLLARLDARNLASGRNRLRHLAGTADVDLAPKGRNDVELRGEQGGLGNASFDTVRVSLRGTHASHLLTARAIGAEDTLRLGLAGGLTAARWRGTVNALAVHTSALGGWRLEQPAALAASRYSGRLGTLCVAADSAAGRVCASGDWRGLRTWNVVATAEGLPAARIPLGERSSSLDPRGRIVGTITARLDAHAVAGRVAGDFRAETDSVAYLWRRSADPAEHRFALDSAVLTLHADRASGVVASLGVRLNDERSKELAVLAGNAALPSYRIGSGLMRLPITWKLDGTVVDLSFLEPFVFGVDSLRGGVVLAASGSGSLRAPQVQGNLGLQKFIAGFPGRRAVSGALELGVNGGIGLDRSLHGEAQLTSHGFGYDYWYFAQPRRLSVDSGRAILTAEVDGLHGSLAFGVSDARGKGVASITGELALPEYRKLGSRFAPQPVTLTFAAGIPDLTVLQPLMMSADSLAGRLTLELAARGKVGAPNLTGTLRVDSARGRLPSGAMARGGLQGDLALAVADDNTMTGSFRLVPQDVRLQYPVGGSTGMVRLDSTALELRAGANGVRGGLDVTFADTSGRAMGRLRSRAALPNLTRFDAPLGSQPIAASLEGRAADLAFLETLTPQVDSAAGRLNLDATLDGRLSNMHTVGGIVLDDVALRMPYLGVLLEHVHFTGKGDQAGSITIDGRLQSGGGELVLSGTTPVQPSSAHPGQVHLTANRFELMDNAELHALVSGKADVRIAEDSLDVRGELSVPLARLVLTQIPETAVAPSDDVILLDSLLVLRRNRPVTAQVRITLGDSVSFSGFNFNAELGGSMVLTQQPDDLPMATGTMYIEEGHYKAYGQDLTIRKGEVRFTGGPIDNPELSVTATRTAFNGSEQVTAGIRILGTLREPDVTLVSEPPMSETQVLSYILTGGPVGAAAGGSLLDKAMTSLGLKGGSMLGPALGQQVGLTQAKFSTASDVRRTSLAFGRFLTPSLYVSYGIGVFDPISTLRLRYVLSNHFTLLAEVGKVTSADALVKVEPGKSKSP
jgi:autotransporter translocation and assembly factor TamB